MADIQIRRGENPGILLDFTEAALEVANFDQYILTIWQSGTVEPNVKITKTDGAAYSTYVLKVDLTQADTLALTAGKTTQLQCKMRIASTVVESGIKSVEVLNDLNGEEMSLE